jgi:DNA-binding CsgD family transcriptional regulator
MNSVIGNGNAIDQLSDRERQIVRLAARGLTDKEIAVRTGISLTTVRTYWERLRQKTGTNNRASAVALFVRGSAKGEPVEPDAPVEPNTLLQAAIEAALGGIAVLDPHGTIVACNDKLCAMLNVAAGSVEGTSIEKLIPRRFAAFYHSLRAANDTKAESTLTVSAFVKTRMAADLLVSVTLRAIETPAGRHTGLFIQDLVQSLDARRRGIYSGAAVVADPTMEVPNSNPAADE